MNLNFKLLGSGKPIIIFHGLLGSLDNWISVSKHLSKNHLIILIDLPNHGKSSHTNKFSYQEMSEAIHDFLLSKNINDISIIGHSMGGKLALNYLDNYPSHVDKVVIVDIINKKYSSNRFKNIFNVINSIDLGIISSRNEANKIIGNNLDIGEKNFILKNLKRTDDGFQWTFNIGLIIKSLDQISSRIDLKNKIRNKTLFLFGEQSNYHNSNDIDNISNEFDDYSVQIVKESGHWVHADNPNDFILYSSAFLTL